MNTKLRQLIRESINEYIREIDEAGNVAALEAKMGKTQEAIELREKKMNMDGLDEAYHDMLDKGKMKELSNEVKALKKSLSKYEKQLEKLKNKGNKAEKVETEEKEIVDEVAVDEIAIDEADPQSEGENTDIYEILYMQKLAGIISETEYKDKKLKFLNEDVIKLTYNTDSDDLKYVKNILKKAGVLAKVVAGTFDDEVEITVDKDLRKKAIKALKDSGFDI